MQDVREDLRCTMSKDAETIKNESLRINEDLKPVEISRNVGKEKLQALLPKDMQLDFQKKITISKDDRQETDSGVLLGKDNTYNTLAGMFTIELTAYLYYGLEAHVFY